MDMQLGCFEEQFSSFFLLKKENIFLACFTELEKRRSVQLLVRESNLKGDANSGAALRDNWV